jgi:hypothetical protein
MDGNQTDQRKEPARRPPPLKLPARAYQKIPAEIPKDMIEWHGILLPIEDVASPITPSHWSVRIENPVIQHIYNLVLATLAITRNHVARWTDMQPVEFLPNLYLGSYYDIFNFEHKVRVSILEDFSLLNLFDENTATNLCDEKLEIHANDDAATDIMSHFDKVRDFLDAQSADNIKFIHCVAGMNRSATLATAYYIQKTGKPLLQAIQYMVALRPIILRNENFIKQLVVWAYDNGFAT